VELVILGGKQAVTNPTLWDEVEKRAEQRSNERGRAIARAIGPMIHEGEFLEPKGSKSKQAKANKTPIRTKHSRQSEIMKVRQKRGRGLAGGTSQRQDGKIDDWGVRKEKTGENNLKSRKIQFPSGVKPDERNHRKKRT